MAAQAGGGPIKFDQTARSSVAWTNATANDTALTLAVTNYGVVVASFNPSGSLTAGSLNFEVSDDGGATWYPVLGSRFGGTVTETTFALNAAAAKLWAFSVAGCTHFRVRLNPVITGTGTANIGVQAAASAGGVGAGGGGGGGGAVTIADGGSVTLGALADAEVAGAGAASLIAITKRLRTLLSAGLPAALVGGRLDVNVGNSPAVTVADGGAVTLGALADAEVSGAGNASVVAVLKRLRTLLSGGLPAALVSGRLDVNMVLAQSAASTAAWTSATGNNTTLQLAVTNYGLVVLSFNPSGSITGGTLNFELSDDGGTNWYGVSGSATTFDMNGATATLFQANVAGVTHFRVRLNPVITGAGTANLRVQAVAAQGGGSGGVGAAGGVTIADGDDAALGSLADAEVSGAGAASVIAILKRLRTLLNAGLPSALVGGRLDVNIGASGATVPISNANLEGMTLVDNAAFTDGTTRVSVAGLIFDETAGTALTENDVAAARIDSKRATINVLEDATTRGRRAVISAAGELAVNPTAETAGVGVGAAADAAAAGNGSLIGVAKQLRVLLNGGLPAALGQGTMAQSMRVVLASDHSNIGVQIQGSGGSVILAPVTSGGDSIFRLICAGSTNATSVKASVGQVYGWYISNQAAYDVFVKLYNKASAPTVGTDTPVMTLKIPIGGAANVEFAMGIAFATGIALAITKLIGDGDTTAVVANDCIVNLLYR
jgi:hypothetical protein